LIGGAFSFWQRREKIERKLKSLSALRKTPAGKKEKAPSFH